MTRDVHYAVNPVSLLWLGIKSIDEGKFVKALTHIDTASLVVWDNNLCSQKDLQFFISAARKYALEQGILADGDALSEDNRNFYHIMTTGFAHRSREILIQDFQKVRQCLDDISTDPDSGALIFPSC